MDLKVRSFNIVTGIFQAFIGVFIPAVVIKTIFTGSGIEYYGMVNSQHHNNYRGVCGVRVTGRYAEIINA